MPTYINNLKIEKGANLYFSGLPLSLYKPKLIWDKDKISRFHYASIQTDLYERENEFNILTNFILSEDKFIWQTVHGEAGVGKSRLALELGYSLKPNWEWGFIGQGRSLISDLNTLHNQWIPQKHTLIIIDYTTFNVELIRETIVTLKTRSDKWDYNVRLLICDRLISENNDNNWYFRIKRSFSKTSIMRIEDSEYNKPILCKKISPQITHKIIKSVLRNKYHNDLKLPKDINNILKEKKIDTPLLALFFVDALIFSSDAVEFDSHLLKKWLLQSEIGRWNEQGIGLIEQRLIRLATLSNELSINIMKEDKLILDSFELDISSSIKAINSIVHPAEDNLEILRKIEPDLLGELFVLDSIEKELCFTEKNYKIIEDLNFIKRNDYINELYDFLLRSTEDFPFSKALSFLISKLPNLGMKPNQKNIMTSLLNMSLELSQRKNIDESKNLCLYLEKQIFSKDFSILIKKLSNKAECASNYFAASSYLCTKLYHKDLEKNYIKNVYSNIEKYISYHSYKGSKNKFLLTSFALVISMYAQNNYQNKEILLKCIEDLEKLLDFKNINLELTEYYTQCIFAFLVSHPTNYMIHAKHYFKIEILIEEGYINISDTFIMFCTNLFQLEENFHKMNLDGNSIRLKVHQVFFRTKKINFDLVDAYTRFVYNLLSDSPTLNHLKLDFLHIIENLNIININIEKISDEKVITRYLNAVGHILTCIYENKNSKIIIEDKILEKIEIILKNINNYNYQNKILKEELETDFKKLLKKKRVKTFFMTKRQN